MAQLSFLVYDLLATLQMVTTANHPAKILQAHN